MPEIDVGTVLVSQNLITLSQYQECVTLQNADPSKTFLDIVLERGLCTREAAMQAIGRFNQYATQAPHPEEALLAYKQAGERFHTNTMETSRLASQLAELANDEGEDDAG